MNHHEKIIEKRSKGDDENIQPKFFIRIAYYLNFPSVTGWNETNEIPYGFEIDLIVELFQSINKYMYYVNGMEGYDQFTEVNNEEVQQLNKTDRKKHRVKRYGILEFVPISTYNDLWLFPQGTHIAIGGMSDSLIRRLNQNEKIKSKSLKHFENWEKIRQRTKEIIKFGHAEVEADLVSKEKEAHEVLADTDIMLLQSVDEKTTQHEGNIESSTTFKSVEDLIDIPGDDLIKKLELLYKKCTNNLQILIKNDELIKKPSWTIPYYTVKRTLIFSKTNEKMTNFRQAIVTLMKHTYKTIIGDMKKLIQLKGKDELNDQENSELEKLLENEKIYKPYLDLLKKKAITEKKKESYKKKNI